MVRVVKTPIRTFRVPDDLWERAKAAAARKGEDVSGVLRAALERYVNSDNSAED